MRQGEDLISARVREDRPVPAHESVNASGPPKYFRARPEQKVISIHEQDLGAGVLEGLGQLRLHRGLGADGHEEGCPHLIVQGAKRRCSRPGSRGRGLQAKV